MVAETSIEGGGTQAVSGGCHVIFVCEGLGKSVFPENSLSLLLALLGFSPAKPQPPCRVRIGHPGASVCVLIRTYPGGAFCRKANHLAAGNSSGQ